MKRLSNGRIAVSQLKLFLFFFALITALFSCAKAPEQAAETETPSEQPAAPAPEPAAPKKYLYVASGACMAGNNTTFTAATASNVVYRIDPANGQRDLVIADYNAISGDSPTGLIDYDQDHLLVLIERNGARRIEKVEKKLNGSRAAFSQETTTALSAVLLGMAKSVDGGIFVSRTTAIGLIGSTGTTQIGSFVAGTGGAAACGTTNTKYSSVAVTDAGHLIYMNSENNDNRIGIVRNGPTCLAGVAGPANSATAALNASSSVLTWIPGSKQIIAAYSGTTVAANINSLYVYDVTEDATTASIGAGTVLYDAAGFPATYPYQLYAVSAMAYDSANSILYVATANQVATNIATSGNYIIHRFKYDPTLKKITLDGAAPFYASGFDTKCISAMFIGE